MDFRTTFNITPSTYKITYNCPVIFIGSCFASSIGKQLELGHMPVNINPAGSVYNPASAAACIEMIIDNKVFHIEDLYNNNGNYLSFYHNTEFSSNQPDTILNRINENLRKANNLMGSARFLFVTFGTARVYKLRSDGRIVSNCHKLPAELFNNELLSVNEIVNSWRVLLDKIHILYPSLNVVFTISPVRHWKDGAHGNQVSKSVLFLSVEELLAHSSAPGYFPAYELLMDDLRDYRFYDDDMIHPSSEAVNYIWDAFSNAYMDESTIEIRKAVMKIVKASQHRLLTDSAAGKKQFAEKMLALIQNVNDKGFAVGLEAEKSYFLSMLE